MGLSLLPKKRRSVSFASSGFTSSQNEVKRINRASEKIRDDKQICPRVRPVLVLDAITPSARWGSRAHNALISLTF